MNNGGFKNKYTIHFFYLVIHSLEKKAFEICDDDEDGGLNWTEVQNCEVSSKKIFRQCGSYRGLVILQCKNLNFPYYYGVL